MLSILLFVIKEIIFQDGQEKWIWRACCLALACIAKLLRKEMGLIYPRGTLGGQEIQGLSPWAFIDRTHFLSCDLILVFEGVFLSLTPKGKRAQTNPHALVLNLQGRGTLLSL